MRDHHSHTHMYQRCASLLVKCSLCLKFIFEVYVHIILRATCRFSGYPFSVNTRFHQLGRHYNLDTVWVSYKSETVKHFHNAAS
jgi:hypothetical protein